MAVYCSFHVIYGPYYPHCDLVVVFEREYGKTKTYEWQQTNGIICVIVQILSIDIIIILVHFLIIQNNCYVVQFRHRSV